MIPSPIRVLVLEDDLDIGTMIKAMLDYQGFSVNVVQRAEKAEELLRKEPFDLLIMDMLLSGINGKDVCSRFKQDAALAYLPIIMMSAHPNAKEMSERAGADDFMPKPFNIKELVAKINRLVARKDLAG